MLMVLQRVLSLDIPREGPPGSDPEGFLHAVAFFMGPQEKK